MPLNKTETTELDELMKIYPHTAEQKARYDVLVDKALT